MDRRDLLTANYNQGNLDLNDPRQSSYAYAKLVGSAEDAMVHYSLEGTIFAYLPNGAQKLIGFQAILKGVWEKIDQDSYSYKLFESGVFHHLDSKNYIETFENTMTNKKNQLSNIRGGTYETFIKPRQLDWVISGDDVWIQEPKTKIGYFGVSKPNNQDKETSFANTIFRGKISDLTDESSIAPSMMTYNYISPWYPFFEMDDVDGKIDWPAVCIKIQSWSDVPNSMKNVLKAKQKNSFESTNPWSETTRTLNHYRDNNKQN